MSDYTFNAKDCLMSNEFNESLLVIPKELWDNLRDNYTKYLILGYTKDKRLFFTIRIRDSEEFDIRYGHKMTRGHSGWLIDFQTYRNKYVINLRYSPLKDIPWMPEDIETIVFKDITFENITKSILNENLVL